MVVVLRSRLWNRLAAVLALVPLGCAIPAALSVPSGVGIAVVVLVGIVSAMCIVRALTLGVKAGADGLVVREAFYTKRFAWSELLGATVMTFHGYRTNLTTYVPVLHLRDRKTLKVHSLGGYRAEIARERVDTLNQLISGRRR